MHLRPLQHPPAPLPGGVAWAGVEGGHEILAAARPVHTVLILPSPKLASRLYLCALGEGNLQPSSFPDTFRNKGVGRGRDSSARGQEPPEWLVRSPQGRSPRGSCLGGGGWAAGRTMRC